MPPHGSMRYVKSRSGFMCTLANEQVGYNLQCSLLEPQLLDQETATGFRENPYSHISVLLDLELINMLLAAFERFNRADLVDPDELLTAGRSILPLFNEPLEASQFTDLAAKQDLPLDALSSFFSALALGAVLSRESKSGRFCFNVSTTLAERYTGSPSLNLCLAYFLQHSFVLRAGTSTHARALIAQTVQACHDVRLHHASHGVRGLHLYLLVYMADQCVFPNRKRNIN